MIWHISIKHSHHTIVDQFTVQHLITNRSVNIESRESQHTFAYLLRCAIWIRIHTHAPRSISNSIWVHSIFNIDSYLIFVRSPFHFTIVRINRTFGNTRWHWRNRTIADIHTVQSHTRSNFTITTLYVVEHLHYLNAFIWITNRPIR